MLPVDMAWDEKQGWVFHTPWPMTERAMFNALQKARAFYLHLVNDMPEGPARDQIERALFDLQDPHPKVRNAVKSVEAHPVVVTPNSAKE